MEKLACLRRLFGGERLSADLIVVVPFGIVVVIILVVVSVFVHGVHTNYVPRLRS